MTNKTLATLSTGLCVLAFLFSLLFAAGGLLNSVAMVTASTGRAASDAEGAATLMGMCAPIVPIVALIMGRVAHARNQRALLVASALAPWIYLALVVSLMPSAPDPS